MSNEVNVNPTAPMIELMADVVKFSRTDKFRMEYRDDFQCFSINGDGDGNISFTVPANSIASDDICVNAGQYENLRKLVKFMFLGTKIEDEQIREWLDAEEAVDDIQSQAVLNALADQQAFIRMGDVWKDVRSGRTYSDEEVHPKEDKLFFSHPWFEKTYAKSLVEHVTYLNKANRATMMQTHELYKTVTASNPSDRYRFENVFGENQGDAVSINVGPYCLLAYKTTWGDHRFNVTHSGHLINTFSFHHETESESVVAEQADE